MYMNQFRSGRFNDNATATRRPGRGSGSGTHHWVVSGCRGTTAPAARPPSLPYGSGRPGNAQQQYRPRSPATVLTQGNADSHTPAESSAAPPGHTELVSKAFFGSLDDVKPSNVPAQSDALTSVSDEGTCCAADSSTPTIPTKGYSSTAFTLQFGTFSPEVIDKQCTTCTSSALTDLNGMKHEKVHHGLSDKPNNISSSPDKEQQKHEATDDLVIGGRNDLTNKNDNVLVPEMHETRLLELLTSPSKACMEPCEVLPKTPSSPTHQQCQNQEERKDVVNARRSDTTYKYPDAKPKVTVQIPASYAPNMALSSFMHPVHGRPLPVALQQKQTQKKTEVNGSVPQQNQDFMTEEHVENDEAMCFKSKTDATTPGAFCGLEDDTDVATLVKVHAHHESVNSSPSISIDNLQTSSENKQPPSDSQNTIESTTHVMNVAIVSNSVSSQEKTGQESTDSEILNPSSTVSTSVVQTKRFLNEIETFNTSEDVQSCTADAKNCTLHAEKEISTVGNDSSSRTDLIGWEDGVDNSNEKLVWFGCMYSDKGPEVNSDNNDLDHKKYSRDFLLTFAQSCIRLPAGFKIGSDISQTMMNVNVGSPFIANSELNPIHGRIKDRASATSRVNHHMDGKFDDDKWKKQFPSQNQPFSQYSGEMLSKAMKEVASQRSISRGTVDERWPHRTRDYRMPSTSQVSTPLMHKAEKKYEIGEYQNPDEEDLESLCKLMSTIGEMIDHPRAKVHMDFYFDLMRKLSENFKLSSRMKFMLEDVIDLRKNRWRQRRKVEGPKKIEEVRRDAVKQKLGHSDEKEVALCMKELNAPSFYPSLVSLWINDSFERTDQERELLAKLLVDLCKSQDNLLNQKQLLQGFQYVLSTLEDAVTDAPKATEFLGRMFAKFILEGVISLTVIGGLLQERNGKEEPAGHHPVNDSLASEVLRSMLQSIEAVRSDSAVDEIHENPKLQHFRRPGVCF
ncbi:hypothetical protein PR202_ga19512 [Eleusine coracana subsp. coracana]|uniref:MI domain-containing protein n=1 Tax=Eleusine coracana subsp. coracana TaxID=191504 RepID=A0AAV5CUG1_ELECO|nr:hypothetical protein PR202_ga19512 [Eleusine coracana subsp. coracana]